MRNPERRDSGNRENRDSIGADNSMESQRPGINFYVATLGGGPGTGTTATVELHSKRLGVKFTARGEVFKRWDRRFGEDTGVIGFAPRTVSVDQALDEKTENRMKRANDTQSPLIVESRLSALIAKKLQNEGRIQQGPRILLTASNDIAAHRVWRRENKKKKDFTKTVKDVKANLQERRAKDLEQWWKAYPELSGKNPMDPDFRDENGEKVYDIVIDTNNITVVQVEELLYSELIKRGYLTQRGR